MFGKENHTCLCGSHYRPLTSSDWGGGAQVYLLELDVTLPVQSVGTLFTDLPGTPSSKQGCAQGSVSQKIRLTRQLCDWCSRIPSLFIYIRVAWGNWEFLGLYSFLTHWPVKLISSNQSKGYLGQMYPA